jgi:hypothetical protein
MKKMLFLGMLLGLITSCQSEYNKTICRQWRAYDLKSTFDKSVKEEMAQIDSMVATLKDEKNAMNVDSYKSMNLDLLQKEREEQKKEMARLTYTFFPNGILLLTTPQGTDSVGWEIKEKNKLIIDETKVNGVGGQLYFTINQMNEREMELSSIIDQDTVVTKFKALED